MKPSVNRGALKNSKASALLLRFGFGGLVSIMATVVGRHWGPSVGGMFLAFPAILPASLSLVEEKDGTRAACDDARGAMVGSLALLSFGLIVAFMRPAPIWLILASALLAWFILAFAFWGSFFGRSET